MRRHLLVPLLLTLLALTACSNSMDKVHFFDRKSLPVQTLYDATVLQSRSGNIQSELRAAVISKYEHPQATTTYPKGLQLVFFDNEGDTSCTLQAGFGMSWDRDGVMMVRDSVIIISYTQGDTIYLQDLVWNQSEGRVFSNNPVRTQNGARVTIGDSFHSDDKLEQMQIVNQRGVLLIDEEEENGGTN